METHEYRCDVRWTGSTGVGYGDYGRAHEVEIPGVKARPLAVSADPAFLGDPSLLNPEQMLLAAACSCQLLSFLAVAARARLDIVSYSDSATAIMPEDDRPVRITKIELRPRITLAGEFSEERVRKLVGLAHRECYIANTLACEIAIEAEIEAV